MRIISKYRDFYDSVASLDTDRKNIYNRKENGIFIPRDQLDTFGQTNRYPQFTKYEKIFKSGGRFIDTSVQLEFCIIGFCGELIPCMRHLIENNGTGNYHNPNGRCYTYEEAIYVWVIGLENIVKVLKTTYCDFGDILDRNGFAVKIEKKLVELCKNKALKDVFFKEKVPVFLYEGCHHYFSSSEVFSKLTLNPKLKDFKFETYLDPYQTYQKIRMFVENDLVQDTQVVVPVGGDIVVLQSKGFDKKTSFRKDKKDDSKKR